MSEVLQTRTEHSRSLEDAERYRAIDTLKELGLLVPVSEIDTFHGRVGTQDEVAEWAVDPGFANGSNDSGNDNINARPTLYTADKETAQDFADRRSGLSQLYHSHLLEKVRAYNPDENAGRLERQNARMKQAWENAVASGAVDAATSSPTVWTMDQLLASNTSHAEASHLRERLGKQAYEEFKQRYAAQKRAEVHEIVTGDADATVIDLSFDASKLDDEEKTAYRQALRALAIPITEGSPLSWQARNAARPFVEAIRKTPRRLVSQNGVRELAVESGIDEATVLQLASAYNAERLSQVNPAHLARQLIRHAEDIVVGTYQVDGQDEQAPVNMEYVQRYLRHAHIVGVKQVVNSATLDREITSVSFFDLEKTTTAKALEAERQATWQRLGGVATVLGEVLRPEFEQEQPLLKLLEDVHAKPEKLVEAAMRVDGYEGVFNGDTGNWERFTLAEHTETVLRNFDENFAENVPVELLGPMRLAILSHDVGKPFASARGESHAQMAYNIEVADDFLSKLGVDDKLKGLLIALIGEGEDLAYQIEVKGAGEDTVAAMRELAVDTLQNFYGAEAVTEAQVNGFTEMCRMLQVCDGGAYTSMAITRKPNGWGRHRNAPSFNNSFAQPLGFGKRTISLRKKGDKAADLDLTPTIPTKLS